MCRMFAIFASCLVLTYYTVILVSSLPANLHLKVTTFSCRNYYKLSKKQWRQKTVHGILICRTANSFLSRSWNRNKGFQCPRRNLACMICSNFLPGQSCGYEAITHSSFSWVKALCFLLICYLLHCFKEFQNVLSATSINTGLTESRSIP